MKPPLLLGPPRARSAELVFAVTAAGRVTAPILEPTAGEGVR
jgi:hypothetical protein